MCYLAIIGPFNLHINDNKQNSQTVPDVRHCSIDGNLVTDERAEAVIAVRRQRLLLLLRRQRHGGAIFSGTFKNKVKLEILDLRRPINSKEKDSNLIK